MYRDIFVFFPSRELKHKFVIFYLAVNKNEFCYMPDITSYTTWHWLRSVLLAIISALYKCISKGWNLKLFPTVSESSIPTYAKNTEYTALKS